MTRLFKLRQKKVAMRKIATMKNDIKLLVAEGSRFLVMVARKRHRKYMTSLGFSHKLSVSGGCRNVTTIESLLRSSTELFIISRKGNQFNIYCKDADQIALAILLEESQPFDKSRFLSMNDYPLYYLRAMFYSTDVDSGAFYGFIKRNDKKELHEKAGFL